jgi:ATP-dependent Lon protease
MDKAQQDYYFASVKAIQKELGDTGEEESVHEEYSAKLQKAAFPKRHKRKRSAS